VIGHLPVVHAVNAGGRGERVDVEADGATVALSMDREAFIVLAGGRRTPDEGAVRIEGDQGLGRRLLDLMAVTP